MCLRRKTFIMKTTFPLREKEKNITQTKRNNTKVLAHKLRERETRKERRKEKRESIYGIQNTNFWLIGFVSETGSQV